ncbi:MAG: dynamin family protein [Bacteroidales bacterium]
MSRFKKSADRSEVAKTILKRNIYENTEKVLELVAKICTASVNSKRDEIYSDFWNYISEIKHKGIQQLQYIIENRSEFSNFDFLYDLEDLYIKLLLEAEVHENTEHTQIVVAGGFSAGKSTLINTLIGRKNLLPTDIDPVSVIPTYLFCFKNYTDISIKGVSIKNALIDLDENVLQCIRHSSKSNIYLSSVLTKILINLQSTLLDKLVFIDTPGWNNSDKINAFNGLTDKDSALNAISEGNILFWIVDIENGTLSKTDLYIIEKFDGDGIVIFLNKADKKEEKEIIYIADHIAKALNLNKNTKDPKSKIIDIVAFSSIDESKLIRYSYFDHDLKSLFGSVRKKGNGIRVLNFILDQIIELFDAEIDSITSKLNSLSMKRNDYIDRTNAAYKRKINKKQHFEDTIAKIKDCLLNSYDEILSATNQLNTFTTDLYSVSQKGISNALSWNNSRWSSSSDLQNILNKTEIRLKYIIKQTDSISFEYINRKDRIELFTELKDIIINIIKESDQIYEDASEDFNALNDKINFYDMYLDQMRKFKENCITYFKSSIDYIINTKTEDIKKSPVYAHYKTDLNLFNIIKNNDEKSFYHCLAEGIDMNTVNNEGCNPLTYAIKCGSYEIVSILLKSGADVNHFDANGLNAFHTAVLYKYEGLCRKILQENCSLPEIKTQSEKELSDIAQELKYGDWIMNVSV